MSCPGPRTAGSQPEQARLARARACVLLLAIGVLTLSASAAAQETLLQKLLRIAGLTAAPSQLRAPGDDREPGNIWLADLRDDTTRALTTGGGYQSPIFAPDGTIYALKTDTIVRVALDGTATVVHRAPGVAKLAGLNGDNGDEMVVLMRAASGPPLATLSLGTGTLTPLPDPDAQSARVLAQIRAEDRVYGATAVYTRSAEKRGLSRTIEWTDVYVKRGDAAPVNVSRCDGVNCGQPALSPDGQMVVFVRMEN